MARYAPRALGPAGKRLWTAVNKDFDLDQHESELLLQAAYVADLLATLQKAVDEEGPFCDGRVTDAVKELRQQRILLARLLTTLRFPEGDDEGEGLSRRPQQRPGTRGAYRPRKLTLVDEEDEGA